VVIFNEQVQNIINKSKADCGTGAQPFLDDWSLNQNCLEGGAGDGAWNFRSSSTDIVRGESEFYKYCPGAGAKNFYKLEAEPKTFTCWSRFYKYYTGAGSKNFCKLEPEPKMSTCWRRSRKLQHVGGRAKIFCKLEPEPKNSTCWSRFYKYYSAARAKNFSMLEPVLQILQWSQSQKLLQVGGGAKNVYMLEPVLQILQWSRSQKLLHVGVGAKEIECLELELEIWVQAPQPWSKVSVVEDVSSPATGKATLQEKEWDVGSISSHGKSALRKIREGKDREFKFTIVIYSCQMQLHCKNLLLHSWINGPVYLPNFNALTSFFCCKTQTGQ